MRRFWPVDRCGTRWTGVGWVPGRQHGDWDRPGEPRRHADWLRCRRARALARTAVVPVLRCLSSEAWVGAARRRSWSDRLRGCLPSACCCPRRGGGGGDRMDRSTTPHPVAVVTVDIVVLTVRDGELCALVIRRGQEGRADPSIRFARPMECLTFGRAVPWARRSALGDG